MPKQKVLVVWFTGLSGAGKTTKAVELEKRLATLGKAVYRLDGNHIRLGLNSDLGFSDEDRNENIRRIAEVALLFKEAAIVTIVSVISPYEKMRAFARERIGSDCFVEVYVNTPLEECMKRDPKGLYKKALDGQIERFTGVSNPYEAPRKPDIALDTVNFTVEECVQQCIDYIEELLG